ncbi:type VI secretion system accessory protein TagJ [Granulicella sp. L60]|uniref:type VI secretion system accessory protein TagJ n=1 Tax=Granulicella sp. L60 TaxID=1641866 RepID=UPI00131C2F53|nr:type VI secretion system accessory protein TagJ [Granulicella sp. L60]
MNSVDLYKAGQLGPAIEALGTELRMQPGDIRRRTFLFELLCFTGAYTRAEKQLDVLAESNKGALAGSMLYKAALHAQRMREDLFLNGQLSARKPEDASISGSVNETTFTAIEDEDSRIGKNLEVFLAGSYTLIPFRYIQRVKMMSPKRLRDLLWARATLTTTSDFRLQDLGEVLLPVLCPGSSASDDDLVRLGRATMWQNADGESEGVPIGQKNFLVDGVAYPFLSIRELTFAHTASTSVELE